MTGRNIIRKKNQLLINILITIVLILLICLSAFFLLRTVFVKFNSLPTISRIQKHWAVYDYTSVYEDSRAILEKNPLNNTALTYYAYSCFYLAVSQLDSAASQEYLDQCINSLRIALYEARKSLIPQIEYMLGKAYFYKNTMTSYYYADLAAKYLSEAVKHGYKSDDIPEYLGLSYAALGKTTESIEAFTEALLYRESDVLLLSIAEQYYKAGQSGIAKQYLFRVNNHSQDENLVLKSMYILGTIYLEENNLSDAQKEFEGILKKNPNSADAYYGLGLIYEKQSNLIKARSEWRKALRIQVNHQGALLKISDYK